MTKSWAWGPASTWGRAGIGGGVLLALVACGRPPTHPSGASKGRGGPGGVANAGQVEAGGQGEGRPPMVWNLVLEPQPEASPPTVRVAMTLHGGSPKLLRWRGLEGAESWPSEVAISDTRGALAFEQEVHDGELRFTLERAPEGDLSLSYEVQASDESDGLRVERQVFRALGERILFLPEGADDAPIDVRTRVVLDHLGDPASQRGAKPLRALSTLEGRASRGPMKLRDLRQAAFLAGPLGSLADKETGGASDQMAWTGKGVLRPALLGAEALLLADQGAEAFGDAEGRPPMTVLVALERRRGGNIAILPRQGGLALWADDEAVWGAGERVTLAKALLGQRLRSLLRSVRTNDGDNARDFELAWFWAGFARHVGREVAAHAGILSSEEFIDDVNGAVATVAASPLRGETNEEAAAHGQDEDALALLEARGSLYAARVDGLLRKDGRSLKELLGTLEREATKQRGLPWTLAEFREFWAKEVGSEESRAFEDAIEGGVEPQIPSEAFRSCMVRGRGRGEFLDLGFNGRASASLGRIVGLREGSLAAKAGLRNDDSLLRYRVRKGGSGGTSVTVTVERDGETVPLTYRPTVAPRSPVFWSRKPGGGPGVGAGSDSEDCPWRDAR